MSRLFFAAPGRVKLVLLALALLPCVPGVTFLLAGLARDPQRHPSSTGARVSVESLRAAEQAEGLYHAGEAALAMGLLCGMAVVWTVVRRRDEEEEKDEASG